MVEELLRCTFSPESGVMLGLPDEYLGKACGHGCAINTFFGYFNQAFAGE
jgi:hypothetical protein